MPVTSDSALLPIFKEWYTDKEMEQVLWRASPVLREIKKNRVGGKTYNFAANYGSGGACAGDATVAAAAAASGTSRSVQFACTPGQLFSIFNVGAQEVLASENIRGAFVPVPVVKMYDGTAAFRRLFATALYGQGFGEIGNAAVITTIVGSNTLDLGQFSTVVKLDIGSVFRATNGTTPSATLRTSVNTVTAINGTSVTFTATAVETWAATDWLVIDGCRTGSTPLLPIGLTAWLPTLANRTGGTWTTYIGTAFYGVDRSVFPDRLAGNYVQRNTGASEKYMDCVVRAVKAVRNAGGNPQWLVLNPDDFQTIITEANAQTTYFQATDMAVKGKKNEVARGLSDSKYMFNTSWVDKVYDDPFCPRFTAYIIDEETIEFAMLSNGDAPVQDGVSANNPGSQPINGVSAPDMKGNSYSFIFDDYVTIQPGSLSAGGPVLQVILQLYGTFALRAPGKNAVINFVS
jgi:hypothetical protein